MEKFVILQAGITAKWLAGKFLEELGCSVAETVDRPGALKGLIKVKNRMGNVRQLLPPMLRSEPFESSFSDRLADKKWSCVIEISHHDEPNADDQSGIYVAIQIRLLLKRVDGDSYFRVCDYTASAPGRDTDCHIRWCLSEIEYGDTEDMLRVSEWILWFVAHIKAFFEEHE